MRAATPHPEFNQRFARMLTATAATAGMLIAALAAGTARAADGDMVRERRAVGPFTAIRVEAPGEVVVQQGSEDRVEVEAERKVVGRLLAEVQGGVLVLRVRAPGIRTQQPIVFRIGARRIDAIRMEGSGGLVARGIQGKSLEVELAATGDARIEGLRVDTFALRLAGSGSAIVNGQARHQVVALDGSGEYRGERLASQSARASLAGAGSIHLQASERLVAELSGSGSIVYTGNPRVEKSVTGAGEVIRG